MKKLFLFINLFFILFVLGVGESFANKKYRYIKREHGVRFQGNIPIPVHPEFSASIDLAGAYAYNWKGMIEVGPYFDLGVDIIPFVVNGWSLGLLGEYNFIKNRGKRKFIPSLGLSVGATNMGSGLNLALGIHTSLKGFVAKRTAFITTLGYKLHTPFNPFFASMEHHVDIRMGFSYYFDFY